MSVQLIKRISRKAASRYIAGEKIKDAIKLCKSLKDRGLASTICPWNRDSDPAKAVFEQYRAAIATLKSEELDCYLSIKAPALEYNLPMVQALFALGTERNLRLHFDSHGPETADQTFSVIEQAGSNSNRSGCTLPARWSRSVRDAEWSVRLGLPVRVVKGQWTDGSIPESKVRENYLKIVETLAGKSPLVAIATHDSALARKCAAVLTESKTRFELEQLYGLPMVALNIKKEIDCAVRVYVPYDHGYLPYAISQIRKRPRILWWLMRDSLGRAAYN